MGYLLLPEAGEEPERLKGDDLASRREEEFLQAALRAQQRRGERARSRPGVCSNCGQLCQALVVYCDADCRVDHEARVRVLGVSS